MKQYISLLLLLLVIVPAFSQAPQSIPYQAVARDASGNLLVNQPICVQFTVKQGAGNTVVYQEYQGATTNKLGLFTMNLNSAASHVEQGSFAGINWNGGGAEQMQVDIDVSGPCTGSNTFTTMGTSPMQSVPYAISAGYASSAASSVTSPLSGNGTAASPLAVGYDNSSIKVNGSNQLYAPNTGTVTNIATNNGLTGGPITGTGTIGIATNGVTYGDIQKEGNASILGNNSGSAASPSEISLGAGLGWNGANQIYNTSPSSGGTVTNIATTAPLTGGPISGSGTIAITQSGTSSNGYLSSTDWNTFNGKQAALTFSSPLSNTSNTVSVGYDNSTIKVSGGNLYAVNTGTVTGTGVANQVAYFSSASAITGNASHTFIPNNSGGPALAVTNSSATTSSEAISGSATGNGAVYGVYGAASSTTNGAGGVYGNETGTSGVVYGVGGLIASTTNAAAGVLGDALGTSGTTYGVYGINASSAGYGVYGSATASGGIGGYFTASSSTGNALIVPPNGGNVGFGTSSPSAVLSVTNTGGSALGGTSASTVLNTYAGSLGTTAGNSLKLASFGCATGNNSSLGIKAVRTGAGSSWNSGTALGLEMDVDNTDAAGASIWLNSNGGVGVGTNSPSYSLDVSSSFRVTTPTATVNTVASGGTVTNSGGYTYVAYTTPGNYAFVADATITGAEVLIVGGGGGGGTNGGGGGGGGGVLDETGQTLSAGTTYNITVGAGGAGMTTATTGPGANGGSSVFGSFTALGGGGGASRTGSSAVGSSGASGGGGSSDASPVTGGTGTQGNSGASGTASPNSCASAGGGGGGAGSATATAGASGAGGKGGNGLTVADFTGYGVSGVFGGGGGGGVTCTGQSPGTGGSGGTGGGGAGSGSSSGTAGTANTGGGGGGGCASGSYSGGNGGSGIVVIRYTASPTYTPSASQPTLIATSSGNVGIGTSTPTANLQVAGSFQTGQMNLVTYTNSAYNEGHFQVTVSCGTGGTLISGGCYDNDDDLAGNSGNTALTMSYPIGGNTWRCGSRDITTSTYRTLTAYAICTQ